MKKVLLLTLLLGIFFGESASAALLYLNPEKGRFQPGETFVIEVRVDNQGECINAADISIVYPKDKLEAVDVGRGESIFSIWITPPTIRKEYGLITMVGGVPGGYCGRTPGDPALTNVIAKIIFRIPSNIKEGSKDLFSQIKILDSSKVVLNNGRGSEAKLSIKNSNIETVFSGEPQKNLWTEELKNDKTPPEQFNIIIQRDRLVFDGKYFAVFSTLDKQTGIDRYELLEAKNRRALEDSRAVWKKVDSPYPLLDQKLTSIVAVRAYDKAGNFRTAEYQPNIPQRAFDLNILWALAGIGLVYALARFFRFIPW